MRALLITLLLPLVSFSQSKKELHAQLVAQQSKIDSLQHLLDQKTEYADSLAMAFDRAAKIRETENGKDINNLSRTKTRYLVQFPDATTIESEENCTIEFIVTVNENGEIVGEPVLFQSKTTTTNTELINKVSQLIKSQAKYNQTPGEPNLKKNIRINVIAN